MEAGRAPPPTDTPSTSPGAAPAVAVAPRRHQSGLCLRQFPRCDATAVLPRLLPIAALVPHIPAVSLLQPPLASSLEYVGQQHNGLPAPASSSLNTYRLEQRRRCELAIRKVREEHAALTAGTSASPCSARTGGALARSWWRWGVVRSCGEGSCAEGISSAMNGGGGPRHGGAGGKLWIHGAPTMPLLGDDDEACHVQSLGKQGI